MIAHSRPKVAPGTDAGCRGRIRARRSLRALRLAQRRLNSSDAMCSLAQETLKLEALAISGIHGGRVALNGRVRLLRTRDQRRTALQKRLSLLVDLDQEIPELQVWRIVP